MATPLVVLAMCKLSAGHPVRHLKSSILTLIVTNSAAQQSSVPSNAWARGWLADSLAPRPRFVGGKTSSRFQRRTGLTQSSSFTAYPEHCCSSYSICTGRGGHTCQHTRLHAGRECRGSEPDTRSNLPAVGRPKLALRCLMALRALVLLVLAASVCSTVRGAAQARAWPYRKGSACRGRPCAHSVALKTFTAGFNPLNVTCQLTYCCWVLLEASAAAYVSASAALTCLAGGAELGD